jgi:hypothetical protein
LSLTHSANQHTARATYSRKPFLPKYQKQKRRVWQEEIIIPIGKYQLVENENSLSFFINFFSP